MDESNIFIAYQSESDGAASTCKQALIANLINPRGMICNLVFSPIVRWAEKRGSLRKLEPSPEFGKWRDELPTFIGNPAPFFLNFGTSYSAQQLWGWDDIIIDLLEQAAENQKSQLKETGETESEEET